jgi:DNA-binding NarL/FixJ family response regulator
MDKVIDLALVDDHKIFRDGIRLAMNNREFIRVVWEADDGKDMMNKLEVMCPDVLLMDIRMPELDGIKALQAIRKEYDGVKIIILSMYDDKETITRVMEYGANAYLAKTTDADEIYKAILTCVNDDFYFNDLVNSAVLFKLQRKQVSRKQSCPSDIFNQNELKILKLISQDKTTDEISQDVYLSPRTVEAIRQKMKTKVGAKTIAGLLMYAIRNRLLE